MNDRLRTALLLGALVAAPAFAGQGTPPKTAPQQPKTPPPKTGPELPDGITFGSDPTDYSLDPVGDAERRRRLDQDHRAARTAFGRGDLRKARRACQSALFSEPDDQEAVCLLADVAFREGRPAEASAIVAPFVRKASDLGVRLRATLAAGLRGQTSPGAEDYGRRELFVKVGASLLQGSLPEEGARGSAPLVAALALGEQSYVEENRSALFFGIALRLDPGNPLANLELAGIDAGRGNFVVARARLRLAAKRGGPALREFIGQRMHDFDLTEARAKAKAAGGGTKTP